MRCTVIEQAISELYPEKKDFFEGTLKYTGRLRPYGGNILLRGNRIEFKLSKKWRGISKEIQIGLMQELLVRMFKEKRTTMNMKIYNSFVKNLHMAVPKTRIDPLLKESFERVNEKYFMGMLEMPNLVFGDKTLHTLGHYDYKSDIITVSSVFYSNPELIDFIMYHEMLHKKHKFKSTGLRNMYHSSQFKKDEKMFEDYEDVQKRINSLVRKHKIKGFFGF